MLKLLVAIAGVASVSSYSVHLSPQKPATTAVNARCSQIPSMKVSDEEQARLVAQAEALRATYEAQAAKEEVAREQVSDQRYAKQEAAWRKAPSWETALEVPSVQPRATSVTKPKTTGGFKLSFGAPKPKLTPEQSAKAAAAKAEREAKAAAAKTEREARAASAKAAAATKAAAAKAERERKAAAAAAKVKALQAEKAAEKAKKAMGFAREPRTKPASQPDFRFQSTSKVTSAKKAQPASGKGESPSQALERALSPLYGISSNPRSVQLKEKYSGVKPATTKPVTKRAPVRKTPVKKAPVKKAPVAKRAPAKKASAKKAQPASGKGESPSQALERALSPLYGISSNPRSVELKEKYSKGK